MVVSRTVSRLCVNYIYNYLTTVSIRNVGRSGFDFSGRIHSTTVEDRVRLSEFLWDYTETDLGQE